ncbi:hypothetical protein H5410_052240, partial [Solanum commersonii]
MELEGKESAIDLLILLPKASSKLPREEDKKSNISKKRKHINRDQEVDEQLRLFVLRACMSGASSSSVPAEVGLISGVDVVMESQTLTTIPPGSEGILGVSLSAPATTATTIHVSEIQKPLHHFQTLKPRASPIYPTLSTISVVEMCRYKNEKIVAT